MQPILQANGIGPKGQLVTHPLELCAISSLCVQIVTEKGRAFIPDFQLKSLEMYCLQCISVVALQRPTRSQDHRPHRDELASQGWEGGVGERGFELEIGVITRYRNRHSLKIFPPHAPR